MKCQYTKQYSTKKAKLLPAACRYNRAIRVNAIGILKKPSVSLIHYFIICRNTL